MARVVKTQAVVRLDVDEEELRSKVSDTCDGCVKARHTEVPHPPSSTRAAQPMNIHSDLMGPLTLISADGNRHLLTAIDDYRGFAAIRPLKYKSEVSASLKKILLAWERQLEKKVKAVRTDRGTQYRAFDAWCEAKGIQRQRSVAYSAQRNGRAEHFNRTIQEKVRAMLVQRQIDKRH
jgi:transposase InsO family protein